jgi:hypothetical protein
MAEQPKGGEQKTLEMRVAELEDRLAKVHVSEEEMKTYQKVASLVGGQAPAVHSACIAAACVQQCVISQCIISQCIISQCIVRQCVIRQCIVAQCIIQQCINECGGGCAPGGGLAGGGGFGGLGG